MAVKRSRKIGTILFVFILLVMLRQTDCVRAHWASRRIRRGMTVNEVFDVAGDWEWGFASQTGGDNPLALSFNRRSMHLPGKDDSVLMNSLEELSQALDQQMHGRQWSMSLTYFWPLRASFRVYFDDQGRVHSVSGIAGPS